MWLKELDMGHILHHDSRIHHHPIIQEVPTLRNRTNTCRDYIALHGSSPGDIIHFWNTKGPITIQNEIKSIDQVSERCLSNTTFNLENFGSLWRYEPKKCIERPVWNTRKFGVKDGMYLVGRLEGAPEYTDIGTENNGYFGYPITMA